MKCCVSTDVEIWTNWLTFEPDPDYSPDAGTALPSSISCKRSNMEFYYVGKISSIPIGHPSLTRGFTMVLFTASCRNTFVRGKCALPSALLVYNYCTHMNRWSTTYIQYSSITAHKWIDEAQRTFSIHQLLHTNESMKHNVHSVFIYHHAGKKLGCRRQTARCFVSLNISLSHSMSLKTTFLRRRKSLLVFHFNCVCISYRFWDIQHWIMVRPWNMGWGSVKVIDNGAVK